MNSGGIPTITDKGIQYTTVTEKFLDAVALKYGFSWNSTFGELNELQQNIILDGSEELITFTDRRGANGGRKSERFLGFRAYTVESYRTGKGKSQTVQETQAKGLDYLDSGHSLDGSRHGA